MTFNKKIYVILMMTPLILFFSQSLFLFQKLWRGYCWRFCFSVSWCPRIDHLHGEKYHDPLVESEWLLCWAIIPAGFRWSLHLSSCLISEHFSPFSLVRIHLLYSVLELRAVMFSLMSLLVYDCILDGFSLGAGIHCLKDSSTGLFHSL